MIPSDPEALSVLAGEYVLGTLDARQANEVEAALATHRALRAAVVGWEAKLLPMVDHLAPIEPPNEVWGRIQRTLGAQERSPARGRSRRSLFQRATFWRWTSGGLAIAAAAMALMLFQKAPAPERYLAVLQQERGRPAWVVEGRGNGIVLTSLNPAQIDPGRVMQLWALPGGATAPTSLGLIPPSGRIVVTPTGIAPQDQMLIEISIEPQGGSPTGRPTGPILFIGRLQAVEPQLLFHHRMCSRERIMLKSLRPRGS